MKKAGLYFLLLSLGFFITAASVMATIMWGHTGSPGEQTCIACHNSFALNSGPGNVKVSSIPAMTGNKYVAGQTYTIMITVAEPGGPIFACDAEIIDSLGSNSGTITSTNANAPLRTYLPNGRKNIFGTVAQNDSVVFSFNWQAPASGEVNMYVTGVRADGSESPGNDNVYSDSLVHIKPMAGVGVRVNEMKDLFVVCPNPANDFFEIISNEGSKGNYLLTDMNGKQIKKGSVSGQKTKIDVSGLAGGTYDLELIQNGQRISRKIIVQ